MLHPTLRRCVFWGHLVVGVAVGLIILILATTGILMSFETQIIGGIERSMVREKSQGKTGSLAPEEMVTAFTTSGIEGKPSSVTFTSDPEDPAIFLLGRNSQQLFHPATGESLGKGATGTRQFFQTVLSIHRWLTLSSPQPEGREGKPGPEKKPITWKDIGGNINAAGCLGFFLLLASGLILWIPKKRTWLAFKAVLFLSLRLKGRARDWNWHNLAGFWTAPLILVISLTGVIMFYPWANKLLFQSVGEQPPVRQGPPGQQRGERSEQPIIASGLNQAAEAARKDMPEWKSMTLDLPTDDRKPFTVTMTDAGRGRPDRRVKLTLDRATYEVTAREGFEKLSTGSRLRQFVRWGHTGELGGVFGQTLAALACAATLILIWTGYALAWRRWRARK